MPVCGADLDFVAPPPEGSTVAAGRNNLDRLYGGSIHHFRRQASRCLAPPLTFVLFNFARLWGWLKWRPSRASG